MKVQELLDSEDKWTQGTYARDENEEPTSDSSPYAVKWCLMGAINKCYPSEITEVVNKIEDIIGIPTVIFNDRYSYKEVIELVRRLDL